MNNYVKTLNGDEVLDWILEHELLAEDFFNYFNLHDDLIDKRNITIAMTEVKNFDIDADNFSL